MNTQLFELIIDSKDVWGKEKEVFHLKPEKAHLACCLDNGRFNCCSIFNTSVDEITPRLLSGLYDKLVPNSVVTVVVNQPISVMQEFDAKQVEANAKCCGYTDVKISPIEVEDKDYKYNSLSVSFVRPERNTDPLVKVEKKEVVVEKKIALKRKL
jgi:hypothetical protein